MFRLSLQTLLEVAIGLAVLTFYSSNNLWDHYLDSAWTATHVLQSASFQQAATDLEHLPPRTLWLQKESPRQNGEKQ